MIAIAKDAGADCCEECGEPKLLVDCYTVCPNGHGRLTGITEFERKAWPQSRKIVVAPVSKFKMPAMSRSQKDEANRKRICGEIPYWPPPPTPKPVEKTSFVVINGDVYPVF